MHSSAQTAGECSANLVFTSNHDVAEQIRGIRSKETACRNSESKYSEFFDAEIDSTGIDSKTNNEVIVCIY